MFDQKTTSASKTPTGVGNACVWPSFEGVDRDHVGHPRTRGVRGRHRPLRHVCDGRSHHVHACHRVSVASRDGGEDLVWLLQQQWAGVLSLGISSRRIIEVVLLAFLSTCLIEQPTRVTANEFSGGLDDGNGPNPVDDCCADCLGNPESYFPFCLAYMLLRRVLED